MIHVHLGALSKRLRSNAALFPPARISRFQVLHRRPTRGKFKEFKRGDTPRPARTARVRCWRRNIKLNVSCTRTTGRPGRPAGLSSNAPDDLALVSGASAPRRRLMWVRFLRLVEVWIPSARLPLDCWDRGLAGARATAHHRHLSWFILWTNCRSCESSASGSWSLRSAVCVKRRCASRSWLRAR